MKTFTESMRHALNGPTMGTRWSALFFTAPGFDPGPVQAALQQAVDTVDSLMSTWKPDSTLMDLNRMPPGTTVLVPDDLAYVLALGLEIGRASDGAFDIGMGDAVRAWGFGPDEADVQGIRAAMKAQRHPAHKVMEVDGNRVRKHGVIALDLNGIAKGHGVDRLAQTLQNHDVEAALVGIDGELRAMGAKPNGEPWTVAVEAPDLDRRAPHSILSLQDAAVATSGDYRHWVNVRGRRLSHTMDPTRGAPLVSSPASVTVLAPTCAQADAWATAFMVVGPEAGTRLAAQQGMSVLFLMRDGACGVHAKGCGPLFENRDIISTFCSGGVG